MMYRCAVKSCRNHNLENCDPSVQLYNFPRAKHCYSEPENQLLKARRSSWLKALNNSWTRGENEKFKICSEHFVTGKPANLKDFTDADWIPTLNIYQKSKNALFCDRFAPYPQQKILKSVYENNLPAPVFDCQEKSVLQAEPIVSSSAELKECPVGLCASTIGSDSDDSDVSGISEQTVIPVLQHEKGVNTEICDGNFVTEEKGTMTDPDLVSQVQQSVLEIGTMTEPDLQILQYQEKVSSLEQELVFLKCTVTSLQTQVLYKTSQLDSCLDKVKRLSWTEEAFDKNDKKFIYYSGMHKNTFQSLLDMMQPEIGRISTSLTDFQVLFLTLIKLKSNTPFLELSYRFLVAETTTSAVFRKCIFLMFSKLRRFAQWPLREKLERSVPSFITSIFNKNVAILMDTFEILLQGPYVNNWGVISPEHKKKNFKKYAIGIVPYGLITFVSHCFDGETSTDQVIEKCGIFDLLIPGDLVLSNREITTINNEKVFLEYVMVKNETANAEEQFDHAGVQNRNVNLENIKKVAPFYKYIENCMAEMRNKFLILNGPVSATLSNFYDGEKNLLDCIVTVCCALHNMSKY